MEMVSIWKLRIDEHQLTRIGTSSQLSDVITELGGTKGFIITGRSLYEKTPVIKDIEKSLGAAHGGTFSKIGQHA
jgi:3-oxoacid CoA-transferase